MAIDPQLNPLASDDVPEPRATLKKVGKGCGCVGGLIVMSGGILLIGNFDEASWASAIVASLIGVLVWTLSGVNGIWEK